MNYVGRLMSNIYGLYRDMNPATLTGAIDVIVIEQPNGDYVCSPFHVRFGKLGVIRSKEKVVDISINDEPVDVHMKLGDSGEAFFVEYVSLSESEDLPSHLATSPLPSSMEIFEKGLADLHAQQKSVMPRTPSPSKRATNSESELPNTLSVKPVSATTDQLLPPQPASTLLLRRSASNPELFLDTQAFLDELASYTWSGYRNASEGASGYQSDPEGRETRLADGLLDESCQPTTLARQDTVYYDSVDELDPQDRDPLTQNRRKKMRHRIKKLRNTVDTEQSVDPLGWQHRRGTWQGWGSLGADGITHEGREQRRYPPRKRSQIRQVKEQTQSNSQRDTPVRDDVPLVTIGGGQPVQRKEKDDIFHMEFSDDDVTQSVPNAAFSNSVQVVPDMSAELMLSDQQAMTAPVRRTMSGGFRPFSDNEISPPGSPRQSRPSTPVKSDTEVDKIRKENTPSPVGEEAQWKWGELPTPTGQQKALPGQQSMTSEESSASANVPVTKDEHTATNTTASGWGLGSMFGWRSSNVTPKPAEGIYLDDLLKKDDPELSKIYLSKSTSTRAVPDVREHGVPGSASHSPRSDEGYASGGQSKSNSLGRDDHSVPQWYVEDSGRFNDFMGEVTLSLCGGLDTEQGPSVEQFNKEKVTWIQLNQNPNLLTNPNLVVRMHGKLFSWKVAAPMMISFVGFNQPLSDAAIQQLMQEHMQKPGGAHGAGKNAPGASSGYTSWFSWSRRAQSAEPLQRSSIENISRPLSPVMGSPSTIEEKEFPTASKHVAQPVSAPGSPSKEDRKVVVVNEKGAEPPRKEVKEALREADLKGERPHMVPDPVPNKLLEEIVVEPELFVDVETKLPRRYKKSLRLSSDRLKQFRLKPGSNDVRFSVTTKFQGTSWCACHIWLWRHDDRLVISDIDGTITKSDVLGQILPMMGGQWAQWGVAQLYNGIVNNGYKIMYLSSRAIGQSYWTKEYLKSIRQEKFSLPDGPLLLSPTSLMSALHREVVEKKPEIFKTSCLNDIKALFPQDINPFYGGFGNRINDTWAYLAVGVPVSKIFTINHRGELRWEFSRGFQSTYSALALDFVDHMFPPWHIDVRTPMSSHSDHSFRFSSPEKFSAFTYWKNPNVPDVVINMEPERKDSKSAGEKK